MEKRHGPSISVKMILTTTALIVLIIHDLILAVNRMRPQTKQPLNSPSTSIELVVLYLHCRSERFELYLELDHSFAYV